MTALIQEPWMILLIPAIGGGVPERQWWHKGRVSHEELQ